MASLPKHWVTDRRKDSPVLPCPFGKLPLPYTPPKYPSPALNSSDILFFRPFVSTKEPERQSQEGAVMSLITATKDLATSLRIEEYQKNEHILIIG